MIKKEFWFDVHTRGLESIGVWGTHAPTFVCGECSLAAHSAEVNVLYDYISQRESAESALAASRTARDTAAKLVFDLCTRACKLISGSLPAGHALLSKVSEVRAIRGRSQEAAQKKGRKLVTLWQDTNSFRAGLSPAQPSLVVGTVDVTSFQSSLGNHAQLLQDVENKDAGFGKKKSQLRTTSNRVDKNNKRWFEAWQGQFPAGSAERLALHQITTGPSPAPAGQGCIPPGRNAARPNGQADV